MRIAIPLVDGKLSQHFGHCEKFAIIQIDKERKEIASRQDVTPPAHEPGVLPKWLHGMDVDVVIAGGMGQRAQQLFAENQIEVIVGAPAESAEEIIAAYLKDALVAGENICDH